MYVSAYALSHRHSSYVIWGKGEHSEDHYRGPSLCESCDQHLNKSKAYAGLHHDSLRGRCRLTGSLHSGLRRSNCDSRPFSLHIQNMSSGASAYWTDTISRNPTYPGHLPLILLQFHRLLIFCRKATPAIKFTSKLDSCLQIRLILVAPGVASHLNCPYCLHIMCI